MNPQIRFCKSFDGTGIAYALSGKGPPLVRAPHWLTHLEYEWQSPIWKPWIESMSKSHALLRMDERGCGLSDRDVADISFEAWVRDLEAVVDAAGLETFTLFGHSQGAAIAVEYAVRHPERVSHIVLLGSFARGWHKRDLEAQHLEELDALMKLVEVGWGRDDPTYRQIFSTGFLPGGTPEQLASMSELQRVSASPECAVRIFRTLLPIDVRETATRVRCPTLILHARGDRRVPFEEGRIFAGLVPGARFVPLESDNHILLPHEPAYRRFFDEIEAFIPRRSGISGRAAFQQLTAREAQILDRVARGLDNTQVAADLGISEKTVRNNITHIFDKLAVESRAQAIVLARDNGFGRA